jgi:general secretion pathway protein C
VNARFEALLRVMPMLAVIAALALGGWLAARWFWYFASPTEAPVAPPRDPIVLSAAAQTVAGAHLFGIAPSPVRGDVVSNLNIKLKGVFASGGEALGFAIINTGSRDETARVGGEIVPGVILESVYPQYVMLRRNGALERVNLEERPRLSGPGPVRPSRTQRPAAPTPTSVRAQRAMRPEPYAPVGDVPTAPPPPVGEVPTAPPPPVAPPAPAAPVAPPAPVGPPPQTQASARGLVIQAIPQGSMLERLGLQPGDVIRSVNGEAVTSEADIARIIQSRGMQGPYTAEVMRGGTTIPMAIGGTN